jgi:3-oxoacyl-ACP reductase-like protein
VGEPGDGWRVAMATLSFERGVATLGQQVGFRRELQSLTDLAEANGSAQDPAITEGLARAWMGLEVMRAHAVRTLGDPAPGVAEVSKLVWANWHRSLGELAMRVRGATSLVAEDGLDEWQRLYLFTRADTIYGGSNEIQRNIIAEHVLGAAEGGQVVIPVPTYPAGRKLLRDKVVVVTAAAGTGIASAVAKRSLEEGARVEVSDSHEQRLEETAAELVKCTRSSVISPRKITCRRSSTALLRISAASTC